MNCIDFRRVILANPRQPDAAPLAHARDCAACRDYLERQREADAALFDALQVPAPDGLADRILVTRFAGDRPRSRAWPIAAGIVLAAVLALVWPRQGAVDPLGREAIAHIAHEPEALAANQALPGDLLQVALSQQGMQLARTIGQVTYDQLCPLAGRMVRHLVVRTAEGPVTVYLLPDDPERRQRAVTEMDGMAAITLPAAKGSIAIVASKLDQAMALEKAFRAA